MRIWSLHPKYLDVKGLVALWRETLLAKKVLMDMTKGYKNHPQLIRFRALEHPVESIDKYLSEVWEEANRRGYNFDRSKFSHLEDIEKIFVTTGQVEYEFMHLKNKLITRMPELYRKLSDIDMPDLQPLFKLKQGNIEKWEKIS